MIELGGLLRSGAVGLVIRPTEAEVIERRGKRISAYARVPIQGTEDDHLVAAIKAAVASAGVRRKAMAVSIAGHDVLVRSFTIPVVPKAEWEGAVRFEARKYIPFKPEQLAWSAQAARGADKDKESVVVFVGIQQERLQRLQALLAQAGVQPLLIEPQAISLGRVIQLGRAAAASEAVCVVDAGPGGGELAILRDGLPFITRSFRFSAESPQARAEQLQGEISLSTAFFQREHPGSPLRGILLFGPDQDVEGWRGQLQGRFAAPVESGAAVVRRAVGEGLPLGGASAAGLALGAARRDGGAWDLLKHRSAKPAAAAKSHQDSSKAEADDMLAAFKTPGALVGWACVLIGLGGLWFAGEHALAVKQQEFRQVLQAGPAVGAAVSGLPAEQLPQLQEQLRAQLSALQFAVDQRVALAGVLDALARSLPEGVWITGLTFGSPLSAGAAEAQLTVQGACYLGRSDGAQEQAAIYGFEEQLKRHPWFAKGFGSVRLGRIDGSVDGATSQAYRTFELSCDKR